MFSIGKAPKTIVEGGKTFRRSFSAESVGVPAKAGWPFACVASGVNPDQAGDLRDHFRKVGIPTHVNGEGDPVYTSPDHRKKALASRGLHDKSSYS